jgi:tetratricopeptide (TPR) repeat protein
MIKFDPAHELLNELHELEPQRFWYSEANILKQERHDKAINLLNEALILTDDKADVYNLMGMEFLFLPGLF